MSSICKEDKVYTGIGYVFHKLNENVCERVVGIYSRAVIHEEAYEHFTTIYTYHRRVYSSGTS
jgi:hypothetical protein